MTTSTDPSQLPPGLPAPVDDGAAAHLQGSLVPDVQLRSTNGPLVSLARLGKGRAVVYAYPRTGRPGEPELTDDWDLIPGARGEELVARLHLPFPVLSDADLAANAGHAVAHLPSSRSDAAAPADTRYPRRPSGACLVPRLSTRSSCR